MEIIYKKVSELIPYINNSRTHNEEQITQIASSIKEFGFTNPILIDENNGIIAGHGRLLGAKKLNMESVPCIVLSGLTEAQKKAYVIADNKIALNSGWDEDLLKLELKGLDELDFNLDLIGFNEEELNDLLKINFDEDKQIEEDDYEIEIPEKPKSKIGDIYQLGNHRLMCGDSTSIDDVEKLMNGNKADMIFTDPPYNMNYGGAGFINNTNKNVKERIKNIIDFDAYSINYLANMEIGSIYIFTSKDLIKDYLNIFKDWKFNMLIWEKTNTPPMVNNNFFADIEYCLYFHKGKRIWNNGLHPIDKYKKFYISSMGQGKKDAGADLHPTMKPIKFISDKIEISSNENGIVLDIFGGSGSTLIACEQLNRSCYMMELDPKYVDIIINRWETFTGQKALKINEGE